MPIGVAWRISLKTQRRNVRFCVILVFQYRGLEDLLTMSIYNNPLPPQCTVPIFIHTLHTLVSKSFQPQLKKPINSPFLAPWKKNLTINTCNPAIQTINPLSTTLKLNILLSVLLTVLKFRFSRVRKYFWLRLMVERSRETFMMDSSRAEVCSGEVPCLEGRRAEGDSFST